MTSIRLKHLQHQVTRHGKHVYYVRLERGGARTRIDGAPGAADFMASYHAAIRGEAPVRVVSVSPRVGEGTLAWLIAKWRGSPAWATLATSTRRARGLILDKIAANAGQASIESVDRLAVAEGRDRRSATPETANGYVKALRGLFAWAIDQELVETNPAAAVKLLPGSKDGFRPWTVAEVGQWRATFKVGTMARLAMEVLFCTMLRRSDAVLLGPRHLNREGTAFSIRPVKTPDLEVTPPLLDELLAAIEAAGVTGETYIQTVKGQPYTAESFTNKFKDWAKEAGVPGSPHGLRKLRAQLMAENQRTESQIMAAGGWTRPNTAAIYTKNANRASLSREAWLVPKGEGQET